MDHGTGLSPPDRPQARSSSDCYSLFAGFVVALSFLQLFDIGRRRLGPINRKGQLVELAVELEGAW
jgi:hypothetical protein